VNKIKTRGIAFCKMAKTQSESRIEINLHIIRYLFCSLTKEGNREQGTGNREQGTGNREQGTGKK